jgi:hypothetical protein
MSDNTRTIRRECHKRLAAQLFGQLPDDRQEALAVLALTRELVDWTTDEKPTPVLTLARG